MYRSPRHPADRAAYRSSSSATVSGCRRHVDLSVIIHRASVDEIDDAIKREDEGEWIEAGLYGLVKVGTNTLTLALEQRQRIHAQNTKAGAAPCQRRTGP
jgi:hypothetical protein